MGVFSELLNRLAEGPVYLTHKEAYNLAIEWGSDTALGLASTIRKAFAGGSLDAALALAERVLPNNPICIDRMPDGSGWAQVRGTFSFNAKAGSPALALCIAILRAKEASDA